MGQAMRRATGRVRPGRPDQLTLPVQRTTRPPAVDRPPLLRTAKIGSASPLKQRCNMSCHSRLVSLRLGIQSRMSG
ncbi:hypothetical protein OPV22_008549 [Ensete ventricosum]|uniref:Uncharacterized protein n=1 Tax=Ensete ventricosum TaxID=4639 RepID=A0AAV8RCH4_ENSVE|nr:hypothetical protein OPV22_008549 [Ensete ventricosum]